MKVAGEVIIKLAGRVVNGPLEGVLLKRSKKIQESGEFRDSITRVDQRNLNELFETEGCDLLPIVNIGPVNVILDRFLQN